jgi:gamma-glutamyltranspeptidase
MLSMLNEVDLKALGHNSKEYIHLLAEVMNLCFADREHYMAIRASSTFPWRHCCRAPMRRSD